MKKAIKIIGLILLGVIFIGTFVFLYNKTQKKEATFEEIAPAYNDLQRTTVATGTIEPRNEVDIKPQISGIVAELYKEAGQSVKKGELIARVKVIPDMSSLNSAENRVRLAQLNLAQAQRDYNRNKQLHDRQLISTEEMEKSNLALRQNKEELANATEALQILKEGVSRSMAAQSTTLVRSTIDGIILNVPVKVGNSVIMSNTFNEGTTIATVANMKDFRIDKQSSGQVMKDLLFKGTIDETEVALLTNGMSMDISVGALPDATLSAKLEFIAPKVSAGTQSNQFEIKGAIAPNSGHQLRAGYSANATIVLEARKHVLTVPESAIVHENNKTVVYVVTSKVGATPQTFERREVTVGLSDGVNIEILKGLTTKDRVRGNQQETTTDK